MICEKKYELKKQHWSLCQVPCRSQASNWHNTNCQHHSVNPVFISLLYCSLIILFIFISHFRTFQEYLISSIFSIYLHVYSLKSEDFFFFSFFFNKCKRTCDFECVVYVYDIVFCIVHVGSLYLVCLVVTIEKIWYLI